MKKIFLLLIFLIILGACNDGDVIVTSFDFTDEELNNCGEPGGYVLFKINNSTFESISLSLNTTNEIFEIEEVQNFNLNGEGNIVNYRKYSGAIEADYFCANVPPTSPSVNSEYIGASGEVVITNTITLDDEDGIVEEISDLDTDGDLLLDYYDFDDDGDNVPTLIELGADFINGLTDMPLNSDPLVDDIPDYLDPDDDGDGVLTRDEDLNSNQDPTDDLTDGVPNYLNANVQDETVATAYRVHTYNYKSDLSVVLKNIVLINGIDEITEETMDLGIKTGNIIEDRTVTPDFE